MTADRLARNPVVLVHGIWNSAAIFSALKAYLEEAGWPVYALSMTPNNGDALIEALAEQVATFVEKSVGQQPFDLVGFSMGGLICRYYVQRLGGLGRVQRFVTVSAPHRGTALGLLSRDRPGIRQMRPGSPFLQALNRDVSPLESLQFFSLWTPFDLLILPPWSSQLGIGKEQRLSVPTHNRMIFDVSGLRAIAQALSV